MSGSNRAPAVSDWRAPSDSDSSRRWWIIGLLFFASVINYFDRGTISVALPLIARDLHFDPEMKGWLLSSFFVSYALMQLPMGWLADRYNLRWVYTGAFLLWSLSQGLTGLATSLAMLIVFRMLLGIGEAIYLPGGTKIVSLLFPHQDRGLPSGIFDCGTRAGLALGAPLTALLIIHFGWRRMFVIVGFAALVWVVPWLATFPGTLAARSQHQAAPQSWRSVTLNRNLLGICLGFFCFDYYWYLEMTWLPDYLMSARHFTVLKAGLGVVLPYVVWGLAEPFGGWIADRLVHQGWDETRTRKGVVTVAFLFGLLLIPVARVASSTHALWLIMGTALVGLASGNLFAILQSCAPEREIGIWTGFENFAGNIGGVLAPLLTGFMIKSTGSYYPGFFLAAVVLVAGLLAYWFVVGDLHPPPDRAG